MRRLILHGPRDLRLEEFSLDIDALAGNQVWVETETTALSTGTDRGNYEGAERVPGAPPYPRWVGYSNVGTVRGVGSDVTSFAEGDRVFSMKSHVSDYVASEDDGLVAVPIGVAPEHAAFTKLYHLGFHSLRHAGDLVGKSVAVVGLGILGLQTVELANSLGAHVLAVGNSTTRLRKAEELGAERVIAFDEDGVDAAVRDVSGGHGAEIVVLTANAWDAYHVGMEVLGRNGIMIVLSLLGRGEPLPAYNPLDMSWLYAKAATIMPTNRRYPEGDEIVRDFSYLLGMMRKGRLSPEKLITHRFPAERAMEAYELAYQKEKSMIGAVFQWR